MHKRSEAAALAADAEDAQQQAIDATVEAVQRTNDRAAAYGRQQANVIEGALTRLIKFLHEQGIDTKDPSLQLLAGLNVMATDLAELDAVTATLEGVTGSFARSAAAAYGAYQGTLATATAIGLAGTGTPIAGLVGVAQTNAKLAWLGGGTLASGGGGMAAGQLALRSLSIGAGAALGALSFHSHSDRTLTAAHAFDGEVRILLAEMQVRRHGLRFIRHRIDELAKVLSRLTDRTEAILDQLESRPYHTDRDLELVGLAVQHAVSVIRIIQTPVLDDQGDLNPQVKIILTKFSGDNEGART
jgi:hypothetical protein